MGISTAHPTGSTSLGAAQRPHRGVQILALACALAGLGGCMALPLPELKPDPPVAWQHAPPTTTNAPAPDLRSWWNAFHDPELDRLIDQALADNLTVRQAALH